MIEDVRRNGFRIIPICPYVRAQYRKHPDWADVMTVAPGEDPQALARGETPCGTPIWLYHLAFPNL